MFKINDIHTHHDYNDTNISYLKNLRTADILSGNYLSELKTAELNHNKYISVGIHPWDLSDYKEIIEDKNFFNNKLLAPIIQIIKHPKCLAIGECGLDKCINVDIDAQMTIFKKQILLSIEYNKSLIIHAVKSFNQIIELHKEYNPTQEWIIHGFRSNSVVAKQLTNHGIKLSFNIKAKNDTKLGEIIKMLGENNIYSETDDDDVI